jgi:trigger factor
MKHTTKTLEKSQVELNITVEPKDYEENLKKAANKISQRTAVKGFRKGKVPYEVLKKEVGEMAIMQEALEAIVQETFYKVIMDEKLDTIGMPKIEIEKVAPGNDLVYKATVALLPKVELADLSKIKVEKKLTEISDEEVEKTVDALRGMHANEIIKTGKAEGTDKLVLDMDMFLDKVPVDGGQAKDHQVYLSEKHYIPGFEKEVAGLKKGDEKEFSLDFPETHYQKNIAGKKIDIKVKIKEVYERQLPELDKEFLTKIGQESVEKLKELIKNNMQQEADMKAHQKLEIEILDKLIEKSTFAEIPDVLVDAERQKMFYELKRDLEKTGVPIEKYLEDIKKDEKQLFEDFRVQAEKRAKASLVSRQMAKEQKITVEDKDVDAEIAMMEGVYKDNPEYLENLKKPEVRDTIAVSIQNKRVMDWLKEQIVKKEETKKDDKKVEDKK